MASAEAGGREGQGGEAHPSAPSQAVRSSHLPSSSSRRSRGEAGTGLQDGSFLTKGGLCLQASCKVLGGQLVPKAVPAAPVTTGDRPQSATALGAPAQTWGTCPVHLGREPK